LHPPEPEPEPTPTSRPIEPSPDKDEIIKLLQEQVEQQARTIALLQEQINQFEPQVRTIETLQNRITELEQFHQQIGILYSNFFNPKTQPQSSAMADHEENF
jgi:hypothetical protein